MSRQHQAQMEQTASADWEQFKGQTIDGQFVLGELLAESEHSAVFRTDCGSDRQQQAAIKFLAEMPESAPLQLSRWELIRGLSHPNLMPLLFFGRCRLGNRNFLYVVTECADEDLSQIVPQRPLSTSEAKEMIAPALDALSYIHSKGFVHGHIKPANIMACGEQLKLSADTLCETDQRFSEVSPYNPPEPTASSSGDVWSLGVTLTEILTQRRPRPESVANDPSVPAALPSPFFEIVGGCLHRDPELRWTLSQIAAPLQLPLEAQVAVDPPARQQQAAAPRRLIPIVGIGLLLAAAITVPKLLMRRAPTPGLSPPPTAEPSRVTKPEPKRASSPDQPEKNLHPEPVRGNDFLATAGSLRAKNQAEGRVQDSSEGGVLNEVLPEVPPKIRATIRGTVRVSVRLTVDSAGNVDSASLLAPGPSQYFANAVLRAARQWKFTPVVPGGRTSAWIVVFEFTRIGTKVSPLHERSS